MISPSTKEDNWMVLVDYNEVLQISESRRLGEHSDMGPSEFREMMEPSERFFTWSNG